MANIVSLFDFTGIAVRPWAEAGYTCYCFDIQHTEKRTEQVGKGTIYFLPWDSDSTSYLKTVLGWVREAHLLLGFPPCDDLAGSGAKHWKKKLKADPDCQTKAASRAKKCKTIADRLGARYVIENPVGALARLWRRFDHLFHPCWFGGYLPRGQWKHPRYPEFIPPRDAYEKKTCNWTGNGYVHPEPKPVVPEILLGKSADGRVLRFNRQTKKLGGKSLKTKNIRSSTPRGWALAVFIHSRKQ